MSALFRHPLAAPSAASINRRRFVLAGFGAALPPWLAAQTPAVAELSPAATEAEVPYVQTPPLLVRRMLQLAEVKRNDLLWDLGSGDGRIVIAAAKQFGARAVGYEIDPLLIRESRQLARLAGVANRTQFLERDLFTLNFAEPSVVTLYLLPEFNLKLRPLLLQQMRPGSRVVSHEWDMGDWHADETLLFPSPQKPHGTKKEHTVLLWIIPAKVAGRWQIQLGGADQSKSRTLTLTQHFQRVSAALEDSEVLWTQLRGTELSMAIRRGAAVELLRGTVTEAQWTGQIERLGQWGNSTGELIGKFSARRLAD